MTPANSTLWEVDGNGIAVGKPILHNAPTADVQTEYRRLVAEGTKAKYLRITDVGKRPDGLGRRRINFSGPSF